jgi:hypothetical protein
MGGAWSMHGKDEKYIQNVDQKNQKERDHLEDLGMDGMLILECIFE